MASLAIRLTLLGTPFGRPRGRFVGSDSGAISPVTVLPPAPLLSASTDGVRTLREDIANFLGQYRDKLEIGKGYGLHWILFVSDEHRPEVEIRLNPSEADDGAHVYNYVNPETEAEESSIREAVVIGHSLFFELGVMLRENAMANATT